MAEASPPTPPAKRRKASKSPTQRSLDYLKKAGWTVAIVERWNPHVKIRQDLFGFADLIGVHPDRVGTCYFQVTSTRVKERVDKILAEPKAEIILRAGNQIVVHGWRKVKKKKKDGSWSKVYKYDLRQEIVTLRDFEEQRLAMPSDKAPADPDAPAAP